MNKSILIVALAVAIFAGIDYIPYGPYIMYPFNMVVTILHELGHAIFSIITGGTVKSIAINPDTSGLTVSSPNGYLSMVLTTMGGYIGSAVFGNLMIRIGALHKSYSNWFALAIGFICVFSSIAFYSHLWSFLFTMAFGLLIMYLYNSKFIDSLLVFLGSMSVLRIIDDFDVGPSGDLASMAKHTGISPTFWMYFWLAIVVIMTLWNFKTIFLKKTKKETLIYVEEQASEKLSTKTQSVDDFMDKTRKRFF